MTKVLCVSCRHPTLYFIIMLTIVINNSRTEKNIKNMIREEQEGEEYERYICYTMHHWT